MIQLSTLRKSYPEFTMEVDFEVEAGELVSILGPSGSGKTTSLRLIAGFEKPDAGRVIVDGRDVTNLGPAQRKIGYVFQDYTLFPHMTAGANIGYGLRVRGFDGASISRRVAELLELMELPGYEGRNVETLSGGERQRVAIARALAVDPVLLLLDEPFSSIDEVLRRDLRREIVRLQKELGITLLFVTHSRQEALSISDRVAVLREGRLVQFGSPRELYLRPFNRFVARFVGEANFLRHDGRELLFRPEQLHLEAPAGPSPAGQSPAGPSPAAREALSARIEGREFLGSTHLYFLKGDQGHLAAFDSRRFDLGSSVTVWYAPEDGVDIPR